MSILIVDDSELSAKIIEVNLRKKRLETISASNGKEALEILESRGDVQMVIADIVMPEMDGLELLEKIRCSADFSDMPVVLCSSAADEENVRRAAQLGCRHYLVSLFNRPCFWTRSRVFSRSSSPFSTPQKKSWSNTDWTNRHTMK